MRAASARRSSGSRVRGIADKDNNFSPQRHRVAQKPEEKSVAFLCVSVTPWWVLLADSHAAAFPQLHDLVEHALSHFPFRGFGNLDDFALRDDRDRVTVGIKANALARNVIDDDCVER